MKTDTTHSVELSSNDIEEAIADWLKKQFPESDGWEVYLGVQSVASDIYDRDSHHEPRISASRKLK